MIGGEYLRAKYRNLCKYLNVPLSEDQQLCKPKTIICEIALIPDMEGI